MVRADSVSDYTNSPLGIPSLYHAEKAYCGGGSEDFIDMNYDTNQYTQGFKPTFHIQYGGKNSTQGYIGYQSNINAIVVSFRGTEDVKNWATDLTAYRVHWPNCDDNEDDSDGGCSVHKGFYTAEQQVINDVLSEVGSLLNQYPSYSVLCTGHSLGAALATLTAFDIKDKFPSADVQVFNYGSPRIFNQAGADYASSGIDVKIGARRTHCKDIVIHQPPEALGFVHVSNEIYEDCGADGNGDVEGNLHDCSGEEDTSCADQYNGASIDCHLLYGGVVMGESGCDAV